MRMFIMFALAAGSLAAGAQSVKTNFVYVVSNIFNNVYTENYITQHVKNTHYNYYYTNNVYTVSNVVLKVFTTNFHYEVINQNFDPWVNQAKSSASQAASSAARAADSERKSAASESNAQAALTNINERLAWFEENMGGVVTNVTVIQDNSVHTNINVTAFEFPDQMNRVYTNIVNGVAYPFIRIYPFSNDSGYLRVVPHSGQMRVARELCIYPGGQYLYQNASGGFALANNTNHWVVRPAFAEKGRNGLRIHYAPTETKMIEGRSFDWGGYPSDLYTEDVGRFYVLDSVYWEMGTNFISMSAWDGTNIVGTITVFDTEYQNLYGLGVPQYEDDDDSGMSGSSFRRVSTTFLSRTGEIMSRPSTRLNYITYKTSRGSYEEGDDPGVWFPDAPGSEYLSYLFWRQTLSAPK